MHGLAAMARFGIGFAEIGPIVVTSVEPGPMVVSKQERTIALGNPEARKIQHICCTLSINGTSFTSGDNIFFDGFAGSIVGASFDSADRLGVRNSVAVIVSDTDIVVEGGMGDIDDVFDAAGAGSSVTLLGASTLLADSVEEGADLILGDSTAATMGGGGERITADGSTITMMSTSATLEVLAITDDARAFVINGLTGQSYTDDPNAWNVTDWNGVDAVTLQVVPEPSAFLILATFGLLLLRRR